MASFHSWKNSQLQDNRKVFQEGLVSQGVMLDSLSLTGDETVNAVKMEDIHVFVCTDESDLRPLAVLINSSMANTR
jgi:hypothetical protein